MSRSRLRLLLVGILLAGTLGRLGYVLTLPNQRLELDESDYVQSAECLLERGSFERTVYFHVPPVVPLLYAGLFVFTGAEYQAARLLHCFLFLPTGLVVYLLGTRLGEKTTGLLAVALVGIYPYFFFFAGRATTETTAMLTIAAMLLLAVRAASSGQFLDVLGFGALIAVASLTRASVFSFILAVPLVFVIAWGPADRRWLKASLLAIVGFLVAYLPWTGVLYGYYGEAIPTPTIGSGILAYQTALRITMPDESERWRHVKEEIFPKYYYPEGASPQQLLEGDRFLMGEAVAIVRAHPVEYLHIVWKNFRRFWQPYPHQSESPSQARMYKVVGLGSFGVLLPFFIAGLWQGRTRLRSIAALYGFIAYFTIIHILLYGKLRYRVPMDFLYLAFAANGILAIGRRFLPAAVTRCQRWFGTATTMDVREQR